MRNLKIIYKSILVIIWLLIIYFFSNQSGNTSTELTNGILEKVLWFINNDLTFIIIRKFAHFTEYLILGLLIYNLLKEFSLSKIILISFLLCILFASLDEIHQLFISERTGKLLDVLIDTLGSICCILIINKFSVKSLSKR